MQNFTLKLHALNFIVEDLRASIDFYQRLGFYIEDTKSTKKTVSADLKLSHDSNFRIRLIQKLVNEELQFDPFWIELEPVCDDPADGPWLYEVAFEGLRGKGVQYENLRPEEVGKVIVGTAVLSEPDGVALHLVSNDWDGE